MTSEDLLVVVFDALAALEVPFMLTGSLASNFYGVPRATQDADLVVDYKALPVDAFAARVGSHFDVDPQAGFESVTGSLRLVARARASAFDVDLFGLTTDRHDVARFERRRFVDVLGRLVAVPVVEDTIINKLRWFALARRRKDFEDARNVIAVQSASIDWTDLRGWCRELGLDGELTEAEKILGG
jgi:hypothetical protein